MFDCTTPVAQRSADAGVRVASREIARLRIQISDQQKMASEASTNHIRFYHQQRIKKFADRINSLSVFVLGLLGNKDGNPSDEMKKVSHVLA